MSNPVSRAVDWMEERPSRAIIFPVAFLGLLYVIPLVAVVGLSLFPGGTFSFDAYKEIFEMGLFGPVILRTIRLSLIVTLFTLLLGYPFAYAMNKAGGTLRSLMILAVIVPFFTSILIRSYAWVAILGARGPINTFLREIGLTSAPIPMIFNEVGVLIGMIQIQIPLMIMTLYATMTRIDKNLPRAAESLGAHRLTIFSRIFVPLSLPGVMSGLGLVFTSSLGFYVTPQLLGSPRENVATQSIYITINMLGDYSGAAAQAVVLLVIVLGFLVGLRKSLGTTTGSSENVGPGRISTSVDRFPAVLVVRMGRFADVLYWVLRAAGILIVITVMVMLTITMVAVIPLGLSADNFLRLPPSEYSTRWIESYLTDREWLGSTWFSIWISVAGAFLATVLGAIAAYAMCRWEERRGKAWMELFLISPMIVPQFVIALALYFIFIKIGLIGNAITYVLAYGLFGFPYVFLIMLAAFQRFDISLVQAAAILGAHVGAIWRRVVVPVLAPAFLSSGIFAFLIAFDDLVVGLFMSTAGRYTLPMRMWADIRNEISPQIAAVALVFLVLAIFFALLRSLVAAFRRRTP
ncbi:ABC transporter permease subunit (plasmid) [Mesorhizobium sp. AR10]|uniref:ABC transporter permease subunit n=1 Tax=Mesorhizobium sp. AR10 TaxID=2865839 RepID=UPI00215F7905|nr:ABC transporter permease subunit [Mesorhizobium sp. AR10]UVK35780.1 ABC transporter permease subunit [Mesorhizobium sp. AR10]